jgi:hypothetical protein
MRICERVFSLPFFDQNRLVSGKQAHLHLVCHFKMKVGLPLHARHVIGVIKGRDEIPSFQTRLRFFRRGYARREGISFSQGQTSESVN